MKRKILDKAFFPILLGTGVLGLSITLSSGVWGPLLLSMWLESPWYMLLTIPLFLCPIWTLLYILKQSDERDNFRNMH